MRIAELIAAALLIAGTSVAAEPAHDAAAVAKTIAPYVDEGTLLVVRIDLVRIDTKGLAAWWRDFVKQADPSADPPGDEMNPTVAWAKGVDSLRAAGGREMLIVVSTPDLMAAPPYAVVPLGSPSAKPDVLRALLAPQTDEPPATAMQNLIRWDRSAVIRNAVVYGTARQIKRIRETRPADRPNLAAALEAVGEADVQAILLPTADSRRVVEEIMPQLPPLLGGGPSTVLTHGIRWAALSINLPPRLSVHLVIQSQDAAAAKALEVYMPKLVQGLLEEPMAAGTERPGQPDLAPLVRILTPAVAGDRLALALTERQINGVIEQVLAPVLRRSRERARRMARARNLLHVGLALFQYADAHNGQWAPDLQALKKFGVTDQVLKNPRQPQPDVGYVYVRPAKKRISQTPPDMLLAYEAHDKWGDGIAVLYVDGHVEFVRDEARFRKELAAAKAAAREK